MSCCAPGAEGFAGGVASLPSDDEVRFSARSLGDGVFQTELSVPAVHCGACIQTIESGLARLVGVEAARVNLSTKRVTVRWRGETLPPIVATLARLGYAPTVFDEAEGQKDGVLTELLRAVAISGFAAGNIMLLSVSVWSGAEGATRDLFHWVSALIALPAMIFAGRIYYRSAWGALKHGRMNMDVPIAIGITMAYALSLYETIHSGKHAYFDASVTLLFFLLIGRTLDHVMREKARTAVRGLAGLLPTIKAVDGCRFNCDPARPSRTCPDCRARPVDAKAKARHIRPCSNRSGATPTGARCNGSATCMRCSSTRKGSSARTSPATLRWATTAPIPRSRFSSTRPNAPRVSAATSDARAK